MSLGLRIAGIDVDLFKEENVILNALTKDLRDPSKVFSDYTQQFSVPASKGNNKLFQHFYDVNLDHRIDIRKTIDAELSINTRFFRRGRVVLLGANMKNNVINSYRLQFIGELSSLTSALEDKNINQIDYSDLQFAYTRKNIGDRFISKDIDNNVVFTLLNSSVKYFWDLEQETPETGDYKNLSKGINYLNLSPSISIEYIFNKIASTSNLEFHLSDSIKEILEDMYLFCDSNISNRDSDVVEMIWNNSFSEVDYPKSVLRSTNIDLSMDIYQDAKDFLYRVYAVDKDSNEVVLPRSGNQLVKGNYKFEFRLSGRGTLKFYVTSKYPMNFSCYADGMDIGTDQSGNLVTHPFNIGTFRYTSNSAIYNAGWYLPDMSQIDFITSLVKMFNLVIIPNGNSYSFLTYSEWRNNGVVWDITDFVNVDNLNFDRQELPSRFDFSFNNNNSMLMEQYRELYGRSYGDLSYSVNDKNLYTSDSKEIEVAFDNAVFERLSDQHTGRLTNIQYGFLEEKQKLIHYVVTQQLQNDKINIGGDQNTPFVASSLNIPSHEQRTYMNMNSTVFGAEIDEYTGREITRTLFYNHYANDVAKLYSKHTRKLKFTAIVPTNILLNIGNEDKVLFNGNLWEIEQMTINLSANQIDFELSYYDNKL